jgi:hypothetical protein
MAVAAAEGLCVCEYVEATPYIIRVPQVPSILYCECICNCTGRNLIIFGPQSRKPYRPYWSQKSHPPIRSTLKAYAIVRIVVVMLLLSKFPDGYILYIKKRGYPLGSPFLFPCSYRSSQSDLENHVNDASFCQISLFADRVAANY